MFTLRKDTTLSINIQAKSWRQQDRMEQILNEGLGCSGHPLHREQLDFSLAIYVSCVVCIYDVHTCLCMCVCVLVHEYACVFGDQRLTMDIFP